MTAEGNSAGNRIGSSAGSGTGSSTRGGTRGGTVETEPSPGNTVWAVIPARYASTRFPGKPLARISGKPMIQHVYERTARAPSVERVLVATDDARIEKAVLGFGGIAVMTGAHSTGTDRIAEAVDIAVGDIAVGEGSTAGEGAAPPGWVLNVQGDEPMIDPRDLERLIQGLLAQPGAVMGTLVYPLANEKELFDPNVVKAVLDGQGRALYFSRAPIPRSPAGNLPIGSGGCGWRHLGVYLYRADFLRTFRDLAPTPLSNFEQLEQLRALEHGHPIHCFVARGLGIGVDVPEDLEKVEALLGG